jgi:hypothetical protein
VNFAQFRAFQLRHESRTHQDEHIVADGKRPRNPKAPENWIDTRTGQY